MAFLWTNGGGSFRPKKDPSEASKDKGLKFAVTGVWGPEPNPCFLRVRILRVGN